MNLVASLVVILPFASGALAEDAVLARGAGPRALDGAARRAGAVVAGALGPESPALDELGPAPIPMAAQAAIPRWRQDELNGALLTEVRRGNLDEARRLLETGAEAFARDPKGLTALMLAARNDDVPMAKLLLERGAFANSRDENGHSALMHAVLQGSADAARFLITAAFGGRRTELDLRDRHRQTALMFAANGDRADIARALMAGGADPDLQDADQEAALHFAARRGAVAIEALFSRADRPPQVDIRDDDGDTPLMWAASYGNVPALRALLERGADPRAANKGGRTALMKAARRGMEPAAALAAVSDLDARDADGYTALWFAVSERRAELAGWLIDRGAEKDRVFAASESEFLKDYTVLMMAARQCDDDTVKALLARRPELNYRDRRTGRTTLGLARRICHSDHELISALVAAGAKE